MKNIIIIMMASLLMASGLWADEGNYCWASPSKTESGATLETYIRNTCEKDNVLLLAKPRIAVDTPREQGVPQFNYIALKCIISMC